MQLCRDKDGAIWKRRVNSKREAASASAFIAEGSQVEEKENSRSAAIMAICRVMDIVKRALVVSLVSVATMALLST